jgi:hypothetical protein
LRALRGEDNRRKAAALAMPSELLKQLLCLSVKSCRKDHARNTGNISALRETASEPSQPLAIGFLIVVKEGDYLTG